MRPDDCLDQDCDEVKARERERMRAEAAEYQRDEARKRIAELERERDATTDSLLSAVDGRAQERDRSEKAEVAFRHVQEQHVHELERAERAERERDEFKQAWLTVCHEGNVPQYEHAEDAHPEGILHGVRQLACLWSGERSLRERAERERDEAQEKLLRAVLDIYEAREYERCWFVDDDGDIGDCGNWPTCTGDCPLKRLGLVVGLAPQEDGGIDKQPKGGA